MRGPTKKFKPAPARAAIPITDRPHFPTWLLAVLLGLVTIALYWPAMRCDFIKLDDPEYVTENPHIQGGLSWEGAKWAFSNTEQGDLWGPLTWLSHMLACQFFGLNPWGHHLVNVLLHAANTALVFLVFKRMTGATWRSLMLAAIFGWHPLHVESVAWVAERKDVLSTFFGMLTLLAYAKYVEAGQIRDSKSKVWYGAALGMFVFGLMSKAMLVTMPFVLLLLDYWPLGRFKTGSVLQLVKEKIPFFVLAAAASVMTFMVQKQGGAVITVENLSLGTRVGNALISYCRYLGKTFWPTDLAFFYPHPGHWAPDMVLLAGVFLCGISLLLFLKRNQYPFMIVGWLWFVGTLVPVIGLVQVGEQAMADRYTYYPSLGILIFIIWGAHELTRRWRHQKVILAVVSLVAIGFCFAMTRQQIGYWKDSETLYRHAVNVTQNNYTAHDDLGGVLLDRGENGEAISQYQEAVRIKPDVALYHSNLGQALFKQHQTGEAISQYQTAIRLEPDFEIAYINLGQALLNQGQTGDAISQFQKAVHLKPDDENARFNLGIAFFTETQIDEAINQFQAAIRLNPDDADAHINLGVAFFKQGRTDEAINQFQTAIRLRPDDITAQSNLAKALAAKSKSNAQSPGLVKP